MRNNHGRKVIMEPNPIPPGFLGGERRKTKLGCTRGPSDSSTHLTLIFLRQF